jgi:hypothetical protein
MSADGLKRPRSCDGCRRLERHGRCGLGYKTEEFKRSAFFNLPVYRPAERCPKPVTISEYMHTLHKHHEA